MDRSPGGRDGPALVEARGRLDADDRALVQLVDAARARVRAGAAHTGDDLVDQVLDAGTLRVQVHLGRGDALLEHRLAGPVEFRVVGGAGADRAGRGHAEVLL